MRYNPKRLIILCFSFLLGSLWMKFRLPPIGYMSSLINKTKINTHKLTADSLFPINKPSKFISLYSDKIKLYSDRDYFNEISDSSFFGSYVIQIPRHDTTNTIIKCNDSVTIFRIIDKNYKIKNKWKKLDVNAKVVGYTTILSTVVYKNFGPGEIILKYDYPTNYPIILKSKKKVEQVFKLLKSK